MKKRSLCIALSMMLPLAAFESQGEEFELVTEEECAAEIEEETSSIDLIGDEDGGLVDEDTTYQVDLVADDEEEDRVNPQTDLSMSPPQATQTEGKRYPFLIEAKAGYFFFASDKLQDVYNKGGADVQLSASYTFWRPLQLYASVEYLWKEGRSLNGHQKTTFHALPLSLGLRALFKISRCVDYYLTVGPRYFFVSVHNHSSFVDRHRHESGLGGFANTGFLFHITPHFVIDLFGEYSYKRMHFHSSKKNVSGHDVQIGGFTFGGGLGYTF